MNDETNCSIDHGYPNQEKIARQRIRGAAIPSGAIENGREFFRRLEEHYEFKDDSGHPLKNSYEYEQVKLCFETLVNSAADLETLRSVRDALKFEAIAGGKSKYAQGRRDLAREHLLALERILKDG